MIIDRGSTGNTVAGNQVVGNKGDGLLITGGSTSNTIGGTTLGARNVISGNTYNGVNLDGTGTANNVVEGNSIGIDASGRFAFGNGFDGVRIEAGAARNTVGGPDGLTRNVISGNVFDGVAIRDPGTSNNVVYGNYIGTDASGTSPMGNRYGVAVYNGASNNVIGSPTYAALNLIEFNRLSGVLVAGGATGNVIVFDYIAQNGTAGGTWAGVWLDQVSGNDIRGCTIVANGGYGIYSYKGRNTYEFNTVSGNSVQDVLAV